MFLPVQSNNSARQFFRLDDRGNAAPYEWPLIGLRDSLSADVQCDGRSHAGSHVHERPPLRRRRVRWAANKRFKMLKFNFKFPIARTFERFRARSRLYRSQILQVNTRWEALAEIYTMHSFAPFSNLNFFVKNRQKNLRLN